VPTIAEWLLLDSLYNKVVLTPRPNSLATPGQKSSTGNFNGWESPPNIKGRFPLINVRCASYFTSASNNRAPCFGTLFHMGLVCTTPSQLVSRWELVSVLGSHTLGVLIMTRRASIFKAEGRAESSVVPDFAWSGPKRPVGLAKSRYTHVSGCVCFLLQTGRHCYARWR
jgi:hypothetical protein